MQKLKLMVAVVVEIVAVVIVWGERRKRFARFVRFDS